MFRSDLCFAVLAVIGMVGSAHAATVGLWTFEEYDGNATVPTNGFIEDTSGNNRHMLSAQGRAVVAGSTVGSTAVSFSGNAGDWLEFIPGLNGSVFQNSDQNASSSDIVIGAFGPGNDSFTLEAIVNLPHDNQGIPANYEGGIMGKGGPYAPGSTDMDEWSLVAINNGGSHPNTVEGFLGDGKDGTAGVFRKTSTQNIATGWHHLALVRNRATDEVLFYVDGNLTAGGAIDSPAIDITNADGNFTIGANNSVRNKLFRGNIDMVRISNVALDPVDFFGVTPPQPLSPNRAWNVDSSGNWGTSSNWSPEVVPNDNTTTAIFAAATTAPRTVFTDSVVTVGNITFGDFNASSTQQSYVITGQGSIDIDSNTSLSAINVLEGSHEFQVPVRLTNDTNLVMATGTMLTFNNTLNLFSQTLTKSGPGELVINGSLNSGGGSIVVSAGAIAGAGVDGDLINDGGTVSPGNSPGAFTVAGDFTQTAGSLAIELAGLAQGSEYDLLSVIGAMVINGGTLDVTLLGDFDPSEGDVFDLLDFGSIGGTGFDSLSLPSLAGGLDWDSSQLLTDGTLSVIAAAVPEPTTLTLLGIVLSVVVLRRRRLS